MCSLLTGISVCVLDYSITVATQTNGRLARSNWEHLDVIFGLFCPIVMSAFTSYSASLRVGVNIYRSQGKKHPSVTFKSRKKGSTSDICARKTMKRSSLLRQNSHEWRKSRKRNTEAGTAEPQPPFQRIDGWWQQRTRAAHSGTENGNKWAFKV